MAWRFERVAGPFEGPSAGLAWDGAGMLFSILSPGRRAGEGRILRFDPRLGETSVFRAFTNRTSGIAFGARAPGSRRARGRRRKRCRSCG